MVQLAQRVYSLVPPGTLIAFVHHYDISAYGATLPTPGTSYDFTWGQYGSNPRPTWSQYRSALSAVAAPNGIGFVDISNMPLTRDVNFIADKGHINDSGHQIYYNSLNAFLQAAVPPPSS